MKARNWHYCYQDITHICSHLVNEPDSAYGKIFTGIGTQYIVICSDCDGKRRRSESFPLIIPTEEQLYAISDEMLLEEVVGAPQAFESSASLSCFDEVRCYQAPFIVQAVTAYKDGAWLVASAEKQLFIFMPEKNSFHFIADFSLKDEEDQDWFNHPLALRLIVSEDHRFCAAVHDYGRFG